MIWGLTEHGKRRRSGRGSVTAETAVVLPVIVAVVLGLVWLISLGATHVRVVDAARETARALARDEQRSTAIELGARVAPEGARFSVQEQGSTVVVTVASDVHGPGGLFRFLPSVVVDAEAIAAREAQ